MKPRFVRTEREMEGRFEEVWALVDEDDDLETWPEDAELGIVGRPATRQDGTQRTSGAARYEVRGPPREPGSWSKLPAQ